MRALHLRFVGATDLPRTLSELDVQQSFPLSTEDVEAIRTRFTPAFRLGAAVHLTFLRATGRSLTLRRHPLPLLRPRLSKRNILSSEQLEHVEDDTIVKTCGIETVRQQPETAKGTMFVSLEDEFGSIQIIVWPDVKEAQRRQLLSARLLGVAGKLQHKDGVRNVIGYRFFDLTELLGRLATASRDFR